MGDWGGFLSDWNAQPVLADSPIGDDRGRVSRLAQRRREIARSFVDWSLGTQEPLWARLAEIDIPVMWITGADDGKFSALARRAAGLMPKASHVQIAGAGHRAPWQNETAFCDVLAHFTRTGIDGS